MPFGDDIGECFQINGGWCEGLPIGEPVGVTDLDNLRTGNPLSFGGFNPPLVGMGVPGVDPSSSLVKSFSDFERSNMELASR